jgi:hypothetical protein
MSFNPDGWRSVRLQRGELIDRIKNATSDDWARVCRRIGLYVREDFGRGSHAVVYLNDTCLPSERECLVLTIPTRLYPEIQRDNFKKVLYRGVLSGTFSEDDMWRQFGFL